MNSVALPIVGLVKQTATRLGGWKGPVDFVVVKMEDFDVVLEWSSSLNINALSQMSSDYWIFPYSCASGYSSA